MDIKPNPPASWPVWAVQLADGPIVTADSEDQALEQFNRYRAQAAEARANKRPSHTITLYCNWRAVQGCA